ncbi:alanine racemase, partial [Pseudolysinimonas sp.]|uniref:alanine racemase n=1 Tax=Pseudolysinimonas sp. TaxID=2680009 RepID=UPI00286B0EFD
MSMREARIDLGALQANLDVLRATVAPAKVMGVVKAQAYGHGAVGIARALADHNVDWLGVT